MRAKTSRILTVLFIALTTIIAAAFASFAMDYDQQIKPNDSFSGSFDSINETMTYKVELKSSGKLSLNVHLNAKKMVSSVWDSSGSILLYTVHEFRKGDESKDYYLTPGVYYLKFDDFLELNSYSATTTFKSANKTYETDNDSINKIRNGKSIALSKTVNGFIAQTKEDEYYKLKLPASGRLRLKVHSDIEKIKFCLYDSNDESLDSSFITQGDETLKYDLAPGVYYLAFKGRSGYGTYSFKAGFSDAKETYTYNNNSINMIRNRKAVPLSKKVRGQIALNDTVDYYKFYVPKTGNYSITINSKVNVLFCNLYDSNNESVEDMSHYIGQRTYKFPLKKGTYYLELNNSVKTGNYSVIFRPASVSLKSVTAATGSFKAEWKKGTCSGYQLQYSTSSDFSKNSKKKTVGRAAKTHIKIKNLKKGKRYYVRIRTYVKYNGKKYYSAWSKVRSVKTKK